MKSRVPRGSKEETCSRKFRHEDYLSALLHARSLRVDNLDIYSYDVCSGLHIGHGRQLFAAHCEREGAAIAKSLTRRIQKHSKLIEHHRSVLRRLIRQLDRELGPYGLVGWEP